MATNQPSAPVTPTCNCFPCVCPPPQAWLTDPRYQPEHPGHAQYGFCLAVWPNCPAHGVCSWCGVYTTQCACPGGPSQD